MSKHIPREFCPKGHDVRSAESVYTYISKQGHLMRECIQCRLAQPSRRADQLRARHLRRVFKLVPEQYELKLDSQGRKCMICESAEPGGYRNRSFHIDHDRNCCPGKTTCGECLRDLLCSDCNTVLGLVKENPVILERMVEYFARHKKEKQPWPSHKSP